MNTGTASSDIKIYDNEGNAAVLKMVSREAKYILDVGCGAGSNGKALQTIGATLDGITISSSEKEVAKNYYRNIYLSNIEDGLPNELIDKNINYDCVICSHVLEHIAYPSNLFRDLKMLMSEKTQLIIALPNIMHYRSRFQLFTGNFNYQDAGIWDFTHLRWYTYKTAKQLIENHGFKINKIVVDGSLPFGSLTSKILPKSIERKLFKILVLISPGFFGGQFIIAASKK